MGKIKKLEKLDILEVELQNLEVTEVKGFEKISLKTTAVANDVTNLIDSLNGFYEQLTNYNGRYDRKANQFTADAKRRFITADKSFYANTRNNMTIHSGPGPEKINGITRGTQRPGPVVHFTIGVLLLIWFESMRQMLLQQ